MKKRISLGVALIAAAVAVWFALVPRSVRDHQPERPPGPAGGQEDTEQAAAPAAGAEDAHLAAMRSAYAELESLRDTLKQRLHALNARLWRIELPADQAKAVEDDLLAGYALLKNPPLLGAFRGPADIDRERQRVMSALARLDEVERGIDAMPDGPGAPDP